MGLVLLFISLMWVAAGCGDGNKLSNTADGKLQVAASIYPLEFFAEEIGGSKVKVVSLVPAGTDPHQFEPTAKEIAGISATDLFFYNGVGLEGWVDQVKRMLASEGIRFVNTTEGISLIHADGHAHSGEHNHAHGEDDPHVWLDPHRAKQQAAVVRDALVQQDPENRKVYEHNYKQLADKLDRLHDTFQQSVDRGDKKVFVVSHAAFGYLADRYGLKQVAVSGIAPSDEPSAREIRDVIHTAREHEVEYILFENLVNPKVAQTVKRELGVGSLTLHTLEGRTKEEIEQGEDYLTLMEKNAKNLGKALGAE
ncbi:MAG: metal ABC transporter substrate-binding protein [Firmicutes bacterium]|nr:metal ABC transporter substrate-binding protein [Melghirimyces thermohalophilus]MDA8352352.1 metal ABC transporter substrate-binding protein [Bacillota bacterium]